MLQSTYHIINNATSHGIFKLPGLCLPQKYVKSIFKVGHPQGGCQHLNGAMTWQRVPTP